MTDTMIETQTTEVTTPQEPPLPEALGARRIAALLAERRELPVSSDDVQRLVTDGHLVAVDEYKGWPMYSTADALAIDAVLLEGIVAERRAWLAASLTRDEAAARIGWHWRDIARMGSEGRITFGAQDRYLTEDVDRLAAEAEGEQYITAQAAADVLEIRPADWKYVEAAGWATPADSYEQPVGRYRTVSVALFRLGDVQALRDLPGVDWEQVRGCPKGKVSPLREYARVAPSRAAVVKAWCQELADRHQVTVWAWNSPYTGGWEVDWERVDGGPTKKQVGEELAQDPAVASYANEIVLSPAWGRITRRARQLLEPDVSVILDTETTSLSGQTIEIAIIDAATGKKRLDTLVKPTERISQGAFWVHGISDADVADAKPWQAVLPRVRKYTKDRIICAYNSSFDQGIVLGDTRRAGKKPLHLAPDENWFCLMNAYATWLGSSRWVALGGRHRALGDCHSARQVLQEMAKGRGTEFTPRPTAGGSVPECAEATAAVGG
ncbi:3'-5' exonuclease [Streptacidiphilus carbonis]|uniref:3'-5' exonuclease n=1 Tax=Streptacidiphilus carbonis TaxID=105422 RepID=UPI000693DD85|nr:3'-5' exonuclease [Streptacidiphilus carbonis]